MLTKRELIPVGLSLVKRKAINRRVSENGAVEQFQVGEWSPVELCAWTMATTNSLRIRDYLGMIVSNGRRSQLLCLSMCLPIASPSIPFPTTPSKRYLFAAVNYYFSSSVRRSRVQGVSSEREHAPKGRMRDHPTLLQNDKIKSDPTILRPLGPCPCPSPLSLNKNSTSSFLSSHLSSS